MDHYLIEHCAPTLASIKTANLFRVSFDTQKNLFDAVRRWNNTLRDKGVLCFCLCLHEHTALIYVVRMSRLQNDLSDPAVGEFLSSFGYTSQNAIDALLVLRQHLMQSDTFPHEILKENDYEQDSCCLLEWNWKYRADGRKRSRWS